MLSFKPLEASSHLIVNGRVFDMTPHDMDGAFTQTADLYDSGHTGPAMLTLGLEQIVLDQDDWRELYEITNNDLLRRVDIFEAETNTSYH